MSQQHLHHPQIRAMIEQVRGKRMPQHVRTDMLGDACLQGITLNQMPEGMSCHGVTTISHTNGITDAAFQSLLSGLRQIAIYPFGSLLPHGHQTGFAAFTGHAHHAIRGTDFVDPDIHQF